MKKAFFIFLAFTGLTLSSAYGQNCDPSQNQNCNPKICCPVEPDCCDDSDSCYRDEKTEKQKEDLSIKNRVFHKILTRKNNRTLVAVKN